MQQSDIQAGEGAVGESAAPSGTIVGSVVWCSEDLRALEKATGYAQLKLTLGGLGGVLIATWLYFSPSPRASLVVTLPLVFLVVLFLYLQFLIRKQGRARNDHILQTARETRFELDAAGYCTTTALSSSRRAWSAVLYFQELDPAFILVASQNERVVLPKRAFRPDDVNVIRELLKSQVAPVNSTVDVRRKRLILLVWVVIATTFYGIARALK